MTSLRKEHVKNLSFTYWNDPLNLPYFNNKVKKKFGNGTEEWRELKDSSKTQIKPVTNSLNSQIIVYVTWSPINSLNPFSLQGK